MFTIVNLSVLCSKSDFFRLKNADLLIFSCVFIYKGLPLQKCMKCMMLIYFFNSKLK